jgi:hypothetical protein
MQLPFAQEQFFQVFSVYNTGVLPLQAVFNLAALVLLFLFFAVPMHAG